MAKSRMFKLGTDIWNTRFNLNLLKDSDKDGKPNWIDCQPYNRFKQDEDEDKIMEAWADVENAQREAKEYARKATGKGTSKCPTCKRTARPIIQNGKKICPYCGRNWVYEKFYEYE